MTSSWAVAYAESDWLQAYWNAGGRGGDVLID